MPIAEPPVEIDQRVGALIAAQLQQLENNDPFVMMLPGIVNYQVNAYLRAIGGDYRRMRGIAWHMTSG